jgi:serine/threonine protein kinase
VASLVTAGAGVLATPAGFVAGAAHSLVGATVHQFEVIARIGAGGMGQVYRAFDTQLRRDVAIKILSRRALGVATVRARLFREARRAASVVHTGVAAVYEVCEDEVSPFLVMELVEGESLRSRLVGGPLPLDAVIDVARQLAGALAAVHAAGLVHCDVKPDNVIVTRAEGLKLVDFGIASHAAELDDERGDALVDLAPDPVIVYGTPEYMSPEQAFARPVDARADVFALGIVIYEALRAFGPSAAHRRSRR